MERDQRNGAGELNIGAKDFILKRDLVRAEFVKSLLTTHIKPRRRSMLTPT
jgi:hypothetical protein